APGARAARPLAADGDGADRILGLRPAAEPRLRRDGPAARTVRSARLYVTLATLALAAAAASLAIGRTSAGPTFGFGGAELADVILLEIRLPRALLGLLVG